MANRYGRRNVDGIFEYADSREELEASADREDREALQGSFALAGLLLGLVLTYGLVEQFVPEWPKIARFAAVLVGGCSSAFILMKLAVLLRAIFSIAIALGILGGLGYIVWKLL